MLFSGADKVSLQLPGLEMIKLLVKKVFRDRG